MRRANLGRLEIRTPAVTEAANRIYAASHQLMLTGFTIATGVLAALFHLNKDAHAAQWLAYATGGFGFVLLLSIIREFFRRPR